MAGGELSLLAPMSSPTVCRPRWRPNGAASHYHTILTNYQLATARQGASQSRGKDNAGPCTSNELALETGMGKFVTGLLIGLLAGLIFADSIFPQSFSYAVQQWSIELQSHILGR